MKFLLQVRFNGAGHVIGELPAGEQQKVSDGRVPVTVRLGVVRPSSRRQEVVARIALSSRHAHAAAAGSCGR